LGKTSDQPSWGKRHHQLEVNLNLVLFIPKKILLPTAKSFWVKRSKFNFTPNVDLFFPKQDSHYFALRSLLTFAPKRILKKERKKREGESEEGEKLIWCEELGKYGGVFIGGNCSIGCKQH